VEHLAEAPPQGIEHHYCPLALVDWFFEINPDNPDEEFDSDIKVKDCRPTFPPLVEVAASARWPTVEGISWENDKSLLLERFNEDGLKVDFSEPIMEATATRNTFVVTLEPPQRVSPAFNGYRPFIVRGEVSSPDSKSLVFTPDPRIAPDIFNAWLAEGTNERGIRCRVVLKGNALLSESDQRPLDGDVFSRLRDDIDRVTGQPTTGLILPSGDGNKGGDFESWFWLVQEIQLASLSLDRNSVLINVERELRGTVTLSGGAPAGGAEVTLSSSHADIAQVQPSVTVPQGQSTARFDIELRQPPGRVVDGTMVIITASYEGQDRTASLLINELT
jgi:hypothetical protein